MPLLGVNLGNLGFLTAVATGQVFEALEKIVQGKLAPEERMRLAVRVVREGETRFESVVLNDVVLTKEALARILDLSASINGQKAHRLPGRRPDRLHPHRIHGLQPFGPGGPSSTLPCRP